MENYSCICCGEPRINYFFSKPSRFGEIFHIHKCPNCGSESIQPLPSDDMLKDYYEKAYFTTRTERGYDNYFSNRIKNEIERVFKMNLKDIGFFSDITLANKGVHLDIGCAAGYFTAYMKSLGWNANGIDISHICTDFARNELKLNVICDDYLKHKYKHKFNLITMWASIEHLSRPDNFLNKIKHDLTDNGKLYISTCRADSFFKNVARKRWRYYNVPEHIHYFTISGIKSLLERNGFNTVKLFCYGSGFGKPGSFIRRSADFLAKKICAGDMMVISAQKARVEN
ncbi:MAG TPA: class I SAM-dependent methyltransferase [Spirochaetota bacterium]|mgnify:CR=1 FL=1|nr:class I SAM-dependent methyltransferase [Spirochaetota bacterium]